MARLRKSPGTPTHLGSYELSGSLEGVSWGKRVVRMLRVRNVPDGDLAPLRDLTELVQLEVEHAVGVDLSPLAGLPVDTLALRDVHDVDLAPLANLPELELLLLSDVSNCRVPERLTLSPSLTNLVVVIDAPGLSGEIVRELAAAIDWPRLTQLHALAFSVGGNYPVPAIELDVGFLRQIPRLQFLDLPVGVWPAPDGPALLEPPFDAVPPSLGGMRVTSWDPETTGRLIIEHLGWEAAVYGRPDAPVDPPWTPLGSDRRWTAYGRLVDVLTEHADEYGAAEAAEALIAAADPALHARLDFDPESNGTGINAQTRDDLEAALALLGISG